MEQGLYQKALECDECSNKGVASYLKAGTGRLLRDVHGDFHRGSDGDDPPIICDFCERAIQG